MAKNRPEKASTGVKMVRIMIYMDRIRPERTLKAEIIVIDQFKLP